MPADETEARAVEAAWSAVQAHCPLAGRQAVEIAVVAARPILEAVLRAEVGRLRRIADLIYIPESHE